jgi:hypothetical protein
VLKHDAMKTNREVAVEFHALLMSVLAGGEWSASHSGCITLGDKMSGTCQVRG